MTSYLVTVLILVSIAALTGLALNMQWGTAGLVNFGVVGFVALGAYAQALLAPWLGWAGAMAAGAALCAAVSVLLALLSIRLDENYLAIVTIGFGEVVRIVLLNETWLTGGAVGISGIERPFEGLAAYDESGLVLLAFAAALLLGVFLLLELLLRSPFGRALRALRDDPVVASALGKHVLVLRIKAFAVGGAVMGLAGALHACFLRYIDPSQFTPIITAYAFMAVIAGGRGSNLGLLVGAGSIMLLLEATRFLKDMIMVIDGVQLAALRLALVGLGIVLLLIYRPQGFMAEPRVRAGDLLPDSPKDA